MNKYFLEDMEAQTKTYICDDCGDECQIVETTFAYAGTHCTNGLPGIHRTGDYTSKCCDADYSED